MREKDFAGSRRITNDDLWEDRPVGWVSVFCKFFFHAKGLD